MSFKVIHEKDDNSSISICPTSPQLPFQREMNFLHTKKITSVKNPRYQGLQFKTDSKPIGALLPEKEAPIPSYYVSCHMLLLPRSIFCHFTKLIVSKNLITLGLQRSSVLDCTPRILYLNHAFIFPWWMENISILETCVWKSLIILFKTLQNKQRFDSLFQIWPIQ